MFTAIFAFVAAAIACVGMVFFGAPTWVVSAMFLAALIVGFGIDKVREAQRTL
jgi:hypothetical protein